jgi:hypothetical protein
LQSPTALRVELSHLPREVTERHLTELIDERVDLGLGAQIGITVTRVHRPVEIGLALPRALQHTLAVQPGHDRQVGRVSALLARNRVERLHNFAHGGLTMPPDLFHHL